MKTKLVLIAAVFTALVSPAQTNSIIFQQLLSPTNSVLMTNAEFRVISGNKIFFKNDNAYQAFHAADLNTNVLAALHITADQLESQQKALNAANQRYKEQADAWQVEQARQQQIQAQQKAAQAEAARQQRLADEKERQSRTVIIQPPRGSNLNDNQKVGAYSP